MENIATNEQKGKRSLSKKQIRVDMTPMVDLGFLLITFFMFTTNFSKPNVMDLRYPPKNPDHIEVDIDFRNQVTFIIGENNRVFYYQKDLNNLNANDIYETSFDGNKISKIISDFKNTAPKKRIFHCNFKTYG